MDEGGYLYFFSFYALKDDRSPHMGNAMVALSERMDKQPYARGVERHLCGVLGLKWAVLIGWKFLREVDESEITKMNEDRETAIDEVAEQLFRRIDTNDKS